MSETDKELEIDLDAVEKAAEKPSEQPDIKVVEAEKTAPAEIPASEGIEEFKKRFESERLARVEAEQRARQAMVQAQEAQRHVGNTDLQLVTSAIDTLKRETDILKANLRASMAAGDYSAAADAQEALADVKAKMLQLENGKVALQEELRRPVQPVQSIVDPVEALASQLSPRSAAWVRSHPEYARDQRLMQKMIAAHTIAVSDGLAADTDEYFETVERVLGVNSAAPSASVAAAENPMSAASAPAQRRSSPAAAPVSRSGTGNGTRPNVVRLSAEEREMAQMMGQTPEEYARNKVALIKAGKITAH